MIATLAPVSSNMINLDVIYEIMQKCCINDLLFGIGACGYEMKKFARIILSQKTRLVVKDNQETPDFHMDEYVFEMLDERNELRVHFDENDAEFIRESSFNLCSAVAGDKLRKIFPNIKELIISGEQFKDLEKVWQLVSIFPDLMSLKVYDVEEDMSPILHRTTKLRHFTHNSFLYSHSHYAAMVPHILKELDSFAFSLMADTEEDIAYKANHLRFQSIRREFYDLEDESRKNLAKKIEAFSQHFRGDDHFDVSKYEDFINLKSVAILFCLPIMKDNHSL